MRGAMGNRFMPGCTEMRLDKKIRLRGLIATYRYYKEKNKRFTFATLGSDSGAYWDVVIDGTYILHNADILDLEGEIRTFFNSRYVRVTKVYGSKELEREWKMPEDKEEKQLRGLSLVSEAQ